jgi:Disulphide bond corrector protein DsbC
MATFLKNEEWNENGKPWDEVLRIPGICRTLTLTNSLPTPLAQIKHPPDFLAIPIESANPLHSSKKGLARVRPIQVGLELASWRCRMKANAPNGVNSMRLLVILLSVAFCVVQANAGEKSDSKIKATATASKIGADGKQTVTITLDVEKGWYIYANPMKANTNVLDGNETVLTVKSKDKIQAAIKYPAGAKHKDGKYATRGRCKSVLT